MRPLSGLRVLAFEQYGAGPFGTQFLADLGGDVIKIETPGAGDYARALGPYFVPGDKSSAASLFFQSFNRNKRSFTLDITCPAGREVLVRLAKWAHATADNLRGDVPAKLGITYESLSEHNPDIVCAHCSGYGRTGGRSRWPGFDYLMQAESGYFALADPEGPPSRFGLSIVDYMAGLEMALGLAAGVLRARAGGGGGDIDVSLDDAALFNLSYMAAWGLNGGEAPARARRSAHPSFVPCQLYRTSDGWIYLMCNKEKFWPILCGLIGREDAAHDARFATLKERGINRAAVEELLDAELSKRSAAQWMDVFGGKIPAAQLRSISDALTSAREQGRLNEVANDAGQSILLPACPIKFASDAKDADTAAPELGADTEDILAELGYTAQQIADLKSEQAI